MTFKITLAIVAAVVLSSSSMALAKHHSMHAKHLTASQPVSGPTQIEKMAFKRGVSAADPTYIK